MGKPAEHGADAGQYSLEPGVRLFERRNPPGNRFEQFKLPLKLPDCPEKIFVSYLSAHGLLLATCR